MTQWPAPGRRQSLRLTGAAGDIACRLMTPRAGVALPDTALLACHPHPLYGGTMDNKVVTTLAAAAGDVGIPSLLFNFRGVGGSDGQHDEGRGECEDVLRLASWLRESLAVRRIVLAGFSFGGFVALKAAPELTPAALITVAPAWRYFADGRPETWPDCPWLCLHGTEDDVVALAESERALEQAPVAVAWQPVDGVGHFFHGALDRLRQPVVAFLRAQRVEADS